MDMWTALYILHGVQAVLALALVILLVMQVKARDEARKAGK